ncbi:putative flippase GtrA [Paludibacter jiangxiensis]|uniref:Putative flippase GtrA n=2 Tax=Paludibacteraceae TaxID=2005523 RepID=A0A171A472_9BACT|nr:putative flippase GtrA [Paludibacter jiangxiensis]
MVFLYPHTIKDMLAQFVKFCVVGASGTVIDFGLTYLFKEKVHLNKYISNSIGFLSAATSNYILNRIWSFENHNPAIGEQYMLFMSISLLGLLINNGVIYLLTKKLHMNFYVAKVIATGVVTLWNFVMNYLFTFR